MYRSICVSRFHVYDPPGRRIHDPVTLTFSQCDLYEHCFHFPQRVRSAHDETRIPGERERDDKRKIASAPEAKKSNALRERVVPAGERKDGGRGAPVQNGKEQAPATSRDEINEQ